MELTNNQKNQKENNIFKNTNNNSNEGIINLLIEIPFVKILPTYAIQDICHLCSTKKYKKNELVIKQGEPISNLYIVKSGSFISSINHLSVSNISYDINSFIQYQNITNEPFLEERKYELEGKITNNEQIPLFIYQKNNFFGDVELISGREKSCFNVKANEDDSVLCYIDRNKWVKLTKRIRIPFTKSTIDKMNRINERIVGILKRKNDNNIDKVKMCKDKINYQIEVNDNYDFCLKRIEKREEKLEKQLKKYNQKEKYLKLNPKEKSKSLRQFNNNKNNVLNLFKYPNILKDETKIYLNKYLHNGNNKKDQRKFKLNQTKSLLNLYQDIDKNNIYSSNNNLSLFLNNKNINISEYSNFKSRLFITNSIKKFKNNSMIDIFNTNKKNKFKFNKINEYQNLGNGSMKKTFFQNSNLKSNQYGEYKKFNNFSNLIIKNIFNKNINNKINNLTIVNNSDENNKNKNVKILALNHNKKNNYMKSYNNKSLNNSMYIANKEEKMDLDKINYLLKEKYILSKNNIIDKLLGKREDNSSFE